MKTSFRMIAVLAMLLLLPACGGGGGSTTTQGQDNYTPRMNADQAAAREVTLPADFPYSVAVLGSLGVENYALGLNDKGVVVGNYLDTSGNLNVFRWQGSSVTTLLENGQAARINDGGQVVGWARQAGRDEAVLCDCDGQVYKLLDSEAASRALALNDLGQTAGRLSADLEQAFFEDNGQLEFFLANVNGYATGMNNRGQILVKELTPEGFRSLLWDGTRLQDLGTLGGDSTQAADINEQGQVVGWSQTATGEYHAFLWENGEMQDLAPFIGDFSAAVAINEKGEILLKSNTVGAERTVLFHNGNGVDLGNFGAAYAVATDLNNGGQIVGWLKMPSGTLQAFLATPR